jgi:hypothetical protein
MKDDPDLGFCYTFLPWSPWTRTSVVAVQDGVELRVVRTAGNPFDNPQFGLPGGLPPEAVLAVPGDPASGLGFPLPGDPVAELKMVRDDIQELAEAVRKRRGTDPPLDAILEELRGTLTELILTGKIVADVREIEDGGALSLTSADPEIARRLQDEMPGLIEKAAELRAPDLAEQEAWMWPMYCTFMFEMDVSVEARGVEDGAEIDFTSEDERAVKRLRDEMPLAASGFRAAIKGSEDMLNAPPLILAAFGGLVAEPRWAGVSGTFKIAAGMARVQRILRLLALENARIDTEEIEGGIRLRVVSDDPDTARTLRLNLPPAVRGLQRMIKQALETTRMK